MSVMCSKVPYIKEAPTSVCVLRTATLGCFTGAFVCLGYKYAVGSL